METYFELLPRDINWDIALNLTYEEVMNSCDVIKICDNPDFWWKKLNYELDKYKGPYYDMYQFVYESLYMGRYNYFKGAIKNYKAGDERIKDLFFRYGFAVDDMDIMRQYTKKKHRGLYEKYKNKQEYSRVLMNGYYTFTEFYKFISLALKRGELERILADIKLIDLPIRYHPRRKIFNKLIFRYIGVSNSYNIHPFMMPSNSDDIHTFMTLRFIYTQKVASSNEMYNLLFETYFLSTLDYGIFRELYDDPHNVLSRITDELYKAVKRIEDNNERINISAPGYKYATLLTDNLELFKKFKQFEDPKYTNDRNIVYDNSRIIRYLITKKINTPNVLNNLSWSQLNILQFIKLVKHVDQHQLNKLALTFTVYYTHMGGRREKIEDNDVYFFQKAEILMKDDRLSDETIEEACDTLNSFKILFVESMGIFRRDPRVQRTIERLGYKPTSENRRRIK